MRKRIYKNTILAICIISLSLMFFIGSFASLFLSEKYYQELYQKTGTYERINKSVADNETKQLFNFFESQKSSLDQNFYTPNEISHLNDVKTLINNIFVVYYIALFLLLISVIIVYRYFSEEYSFFISKVLFYSGFLTIFIVIIMAIFSISSFSGTFEDFHRVFFNGNYMFPYSSNMIKMFSEEFFQLFAARIFLISGVKGIVAITLSAILIWKKKIRFFAE